MYNSDLFIENRIVTGYEGDQPRVEIPEGITRIGARAFYGCRTLKELVLPASLDTIEESAFFGCSSLSNIIFRSGLKVIENHAFASCNALNELSLPEGLLKIEQSAFSPCGSLTKLTLPSTLEYIGEFAFSCCRALTEISFPDSLSRIDRSAFSMCSRLRSVTLPAGLKSIVRGVFLGCTMLKELNIGKNLSSVENNAFSGCSSLLRINTDPDNPFLRDIDGVLYSRDGKRLVYFPGGRMEIVIPDLVTEIGDEAFYENRNFDRIKLPPSLISIGDRTFYGCSELLEIVFPGTLRHIGQSAFERCSKLKEIYIPDSVRSIGDSAFRTCKALMWLRLPEAVPFDLHWFCAPNDPPCYSADHTIIPFVSTRNFSDIQSDIGKRRAALGMIMAENAGTAADPYVTASYTDYIRSNISSYYDDMLADDGILRWMLAKSLVPKDDVERLLERSSGLGKAGASAMLLDYKTKKDVAVTDAPKISLDDRFDALEHALDL